MKLDFDNFIFLHFEPKFFSQGIAAYLKRSLNFIFWNVFQIFTRIDALCIRKRKAYC